MVIDLVRNKRSIGVPIFSCDQRLSFLFHELENTLISK
jgi:hypothetical protein